MKLIFNFEPNSTIIKYGFPIKAKQDDSYIYITLQYNDIS